MTHQRDRFMTKATSAAFVAVCCFVVTCQFFEPTETAREVTDFAVVVRPDSPHDALASILSGDGAMDPHTLEQAVALESKDPKFQAELQVLQAEDAPALREYTHQMATLQRHPLPPTQMHRLASQIRAGSKWYKRYAALVLSSDWLRALRTTKNGMQPRVILRPPLHIPESLGLMGLSTHARHAGETLSENYKKCVAELMKGAGSLNGEVAQKMRSKDKVFLKEYDALLAKMPEEKKKFEETEVMLTKKGAHAATSCDIDPAVVTGKEAAGMCQKKLRADVTEAMKLLKAKDPWFLAYSDLIKHSAWYRDYEVETAKGMQRCGQAAKELHGDDHKEGKDSDHKEGKDSDHKKPESFKSKDLAVKRDSKPVKELEDKENKKEAQDEKTDKKEKDEEKERKETAKHKEKEKKEEEDTKEEEKKEDKEEKKEEKRATIKKEEKKKEEEKKEKDKDKAQEKKMEEDVKKKKEKKLEKKAEKSKELNQDKAKLTKMGKDAEKREEKTKQKEKKEVKEIDKQEKKEEEKHEKKKPRSPEVASELKKAKNALNEASGEKEAGEARVAVDRAMTKTTPDPSAAGQIVRAMHTLDVAKKWADKALTRHATALTPADGWVEGEVAAALETRRSVEKVATTMEAVVLATQQKVVVQQQREDRDTGKRQALRKPIHLAKEAAEDAEKSVTHARDALAATTGTRARILARHELEDARGAVHDANTILRAEIQRRSTVLKANVRKDDRALEGETELHFQAQHAQERAQAVLLLVGRVVRYARAAHAARLRAQVVRAKEKAMEKGHKEVVKERAGKARAKAHVQVTEAKQRRAAHLAAEALEAGLRARVLMDKAAKAGRIAAAKLAELVEVKANLYRLTHPGKSVAGGVVMEAAAAMLAIQASETEHAAASARASAHALSGEITFAGVPGEAGQHARMGAVVPSNLDLEHWAGEKAMWRAYYKRLYAAKLDKARREEQAIAHVVRDTLHKEKGADTRAGRLAVARKMQEAAGAESDEDRGSFKERLSILLG